jgi:hypothetical protein
MNEDVEELVREGLDRLAAVAEVPAGLAGRARRHSRRRRLAAGSAVAGGIATVVTAAAVIAATGAAVSPAGTHGATRAQTDAFIVLRHMESALAQQKLVMRGNTTSVMSGVHGSTLSITWSYRNQDRYLEFSNGKRYLADGTGEIGGKLRSVYVTYFDRKWSGGGSPYNMPVNACGKNAVLMGGPALPAPDWPSFIKSTLACGAATEAGHVWINGVDTIEITGLPHTTGLPKGMVAQTKARITYRLYVNPSTYLPVRAIGTTFSHGGKAGSYAYTSVTGIRWLKPSTANVAQTLITIPPGFRHVKSAADQ